MRCWKLKSVALGHLSERTCGCPGRGGRDVGEHSGCVMAEHKSCEGLGSLSSAPAVLTGEVLQFTNGKAGLAQGFKHVRVFFVLERHKKPMSEFFSSRKA